MGVTVVKSAQSSVRRITVQCFYRDLRVNITFLLKNWIVQTLVWWQIMMKSHLEWPGLLSRKPIQASDVLVQSYDI